ncbi:MAG: methyltransferase domain-containing protein [Oligoflexia bacterium]|nr:methyltransferase domain-containing protein [Oligoflexia bacterium]
MNFVPVSPDPREQPIGPATSHLGDGASLPQHRWNPVEYARVAAYVQVREALHLLGYYQFRGDERVLDVGSGDGGFTALHLAPRVPHGLVVGLDSDVAMLEGAQANYPSANYPHLRFVLGDVRRISAALNALSREAPAAFDLIFSNSALHHLYTHEEHQRALIEMRRHAHPETTLLCSFAGKGNFQDLRTALDTISQREPYTHAFKGFSYPLWLPEEEQYAQLLERSGFAPQYLELQHRTMQLPDIDALAGWIRYSVRSYMSRLAGESEETKTRFSLQAAEEYLKLVPPEPDGGCSLTVSNLILVADAV